jgi:cellulose synthase/poly-beta-1,6-N-acetylglucosamine synthase-like glycosyltransferase
MYRKCQLNFLTFTHIFYIFFWRKTLRLTIGICAYNEEENIGNLLENIIKDQWLSENSEVYLVASGCTDATVKIAQKYAEQDKRIKIIEESIRQGKASAVNRILMNASCESIIFISADTLPWKNCFKKLASKLQAPGVGIVCGKPLPVNKTNSLTDRLVRILWSFHDVVFIELNDAGLARHATEVFCIRKGIVHEIPAETINDDSYIALFAKKRGWQIKYDPSAIVSICGPQTFPDYVKQRRRILFGHSQVRIATGQSPQHLLYLLPHHPLITTKLLAWLIKENGLFMFLTFVLVEMLINATTFNGRSSAKNNVAWSVAKSTKKVRLN